MEEKRTITLDAIDSAESHFGRACEIWNAFGVGSPQLQAQAARAALTEYLQAIEFLDSADIDSLLKRHRLSVLSFRERLLAQAASMRFYATDNIDEQLRHARDSLHHLKQAAQLLNESKERDDDLLFRVERDILFAQGYEQMICARVAGREERLSEAVASYKLAESAFLQVMNLYERKDPRLKDVKSKIETSDKSPEDGDNKVEITEMSGRVIFLRLDDEYEPSSDESMYRRAAANLYSSAGSRCNIEALQLLTNGATALAIEAKLTQSIEFIYFAMESIPSNLEFHRDLTNAWKIKGERFGCPLVETATAFHTKCPIAIRELAGKWYVSPTLEYDALVCSVCGKDALECTHLPGEEVDGVRVSYHRANPSIVSLSLVDIPEDPRCHIEWLSLPKKFFPSKPDNVSQPRCFICRRAVEEKERTQLAND
jgi:tetratricopeptide (TPR) repeat protein